MNPSKNILRHALIGIICSGAILSLAPRASAQNLFVSDYLAGNIYEYSSGGVQSTLATGLGNLAAVAFNGNGDLYAADEGGNVYKFINTGGTLSTTPTLVAASLSTPTGLAFDTSGNLYIGNSTAGNIIKITTGGVSSTFASGLSTPTGLAFDASGNLYVADRGDNTIAKITSGGTVSTFASGLADPFGMAFDSAGNLLVANLNHYAPNSTITKITPGGVQSTFASGLNIPNELAFDNSGELMVAQGRTPDVLVLGTNGVVQRTIVITGLSDANGLAFQGVSLPVPEPSAMALTCIGGLFALSRRFRKNLNS